MLDQEFGEPPSGSGNDDFHQMVQWRMNGLLSAVSADRHPAEAEIQVCFARTTLDSGFARYDGNAPGLVAHQVCEPMS